MLNAENRFVQDLKAGNQKEVEQQDVDGIVKDHRNNGRTIPEDPVTKGEFNRAPLF